MKNKRVILTFLVVVLLLVPFAVFGATLHVGPGQTYNGTTQDVINRAINDAKSGDTVYLHAATYNITKAILLKSGITLRGDGSSTVIHAAGDNVCNNPGNEKESSYIIGNDVSNVTVSNLRFTTTANDKNDGGHGDGRNCIQFRRSSNCTVSNITVSRWQWCDGVRVSKSSGITVRDCDINAAHDGISFFSSNNCKAYNNNISVQINNAIRVYSSENVEIYKNTFTSSSELGGWCCVQIQESARNVNIHHNIFHDTAGKPGIAPYNFSGSSIQVHDNVFWNCPTVKDEGSFKGQLSFTNNETNPAEKSVSAWVQKGFGRGSSGSGTVSSGSSSSINSSSNTGSSNNSSSSSNKNNNTQSSNQGNSSQSSGYIPPEIRNSMLQDRYNGLIQRIEALQGNRNTITTSNTSNNKYTVSYIPVSSSNASKTNNQVYILQLNKNTSTSSSKNNISNNNNKNGAQYLIVPNLTNQDLYGRFAR